MLSTFRRLYTESKKANMRYTVLKAFLAVAAGLFIGGAALGLGASEAYAASPQTQVESTAVGTANGEQADDGSATLLLFMGGTLLIILFVVVVAVSTATSTAAIAGADET